jgi:excisionase family DNA binding protein
VRQTVTDVPLETMLTARQVADFLQVSICTVRRWSDKGVLKFYRIGPRANRGYRREDVVGFLEESTSRRQDSLQTQR